LPQTIRAGDSQEPPRARDAASAVGELEPGPGDQVADRLRHEHLARGGRGGDGDRDVESDAAHVSVDELDLPCVHAGPGSDAGCCDRRRAADGAGRPVEAREQPAAPA
jgi:hypothetical protein